MSEVERMADQLDRAWRGPAWHGPSVQEVLAGIDAAAAARRPIPDGHTIWEITEHIAAWEHIGRRRIEGEIVTATDAMDWPAVSDFSAESWQRTRERLAAGHERLRGTIAAFPEAKLDQIRPDGETSWYVLIHGIVQHDLYHSGQIGLLAKAK